MDASYGVRSCQHRERRRIPFEREGAHGGLMCVAFVPLLLRVDLRPAGMPHRLCGPLHARVPEKFWTLETPVYPGFLATACSHWRDPGILLQGGEADGYRRVAPEGDQETGNAETVQRRGGPETGGNRDGGWARWAMAGSKAAIASKVTRS